MNYLAHLLLSPADTDVMIGNLMGDFIKGQAIERLPNKIAAGVKLHRAIDKFTDNHPQVRALKPLLTPERKRFAGIISDIVFDHLIALNWRDITANYWTVHQQTELSVFSRQCYSFFPDYYSVMPDAMNTMVKRMAAGDWLLGYQNFTSVDGAINGVSRRIRFDNHLAGASTEVTDHFCSYQTCFEKFFPELCQFVETYLNDLSDR